jgi:hypothetical protein
VASKCESRSRPARISPIKRIVASGGYIQTPWMVTQLRWWEAHEVRSTASGRKSLHHPNRGLLQLEYTSFQANDDPALKLVIYTPV